MKKTILFLLLCLLIGCTGISEETNKPIEETQEEIIPVSKDGVEENDFLDSLTLDEKIGQLFIVRPDALTTGISFESPENRNGITVLTEEMEYLHSQYPVGGFILFEKNISDASQLKILCEGLHGLGRIRPIISIDEEGGTIARLANSEKIEVKKFESMNQIGECNDPDQAYDVGYTIGSYLYEMGIDLDYAPVVDVYTNSANKVIKERSFGENPEIVTSLSEKVICGLHDAGILSVIKHYPGHGNTEEDSHSDMAYSYKTWKELEECELIPFKALMNRADMVMVGHIILPNVTSDDKPASLSYELITEKLRNELRYEGVIITDSMSMGAISKYYSASDAAVEAIAAGCDIILMPSDFYSAFDGVKEAVLNGTISMERLDESVTRILELKGIISK